MDILNWDERLLPYSQTVSELTVKLQSLAAGFERLDKPSPIERVFGRVKSVSSIVEKAKRKNIPSERMFTDIEDIAGIRIIARFLSDIDAVIGLLRGRNGLDLTIIRERDYISNIKQSGYRSYHIIANYPVITAFGLTETLCEFQIRTMAMDFWATGEHSLRYKYKGNIPGHIQRRLITTSEAAARLDNEMNEIRDDILEAQSSVNLRMALIDDILKNIQALHYDSNLKQVEELNADFYRIYESGTMEELAEFNRQIKLIREIYRT